MSSIMVCAGAETVERSAIIMINSRFISVFPIKSRFPEILQRSTFFLLPRMQLIALQQPFPWSYRSSPGPASWFHEQKPAAKRKKRSILSFCIKKQLFVPWEIQFLHILFPLRESSVGIVLFGVVLQEHLVAIRNAVFHRFGVFSKFCI